VVRVRVLAFAAVRDLLGEHRLEIELEDGSRVGAAWDRLAAGHERLAALRPSVRVARNGRIVSFEERIADGDELALLPPVGGG